MSILHPKRFFFTPLAWLPLLVCAATATAQLPDCNCYFFSDCPAETPICELTVDGDPVQGPLDPDRSCEWREPKPTSPGTGCDQPYDGSGGPCDGLCVSAPSGPVTQQWDHWDRRPGAGSGGTGCLPGGPYSYFIKFVVENEPCDLPAHCSLCEAEIFIPSGTLAAGTAALVESTLTADCTAAGFTFDVTGQRVFAETQAQIFDVCVNGVKVASAVSPPGQAQICQDGVDPVSFQVTGDFLMAPALSPGGIAILITLMLTGSLVAFARRAGASRS